MVRNVPIEIEPVKMTLTDKKEYEFLLSAGGINRLKTKFGVKTLKEILALDEQAALSILYEALVNKNGMTETQFQDLVPFHPKHIGDAVTMLFGQSLPDPMGGPPAPVMSKPTTAVQ